MKLKKIALTISIIFFGLFICIDFSNMIGANSASTPVTYTVSKSDIHRLDVKVDGYGGVDDGNREIRETEISYELADDESMKFVFHPDKNEVVEKVILNDAEINTISIKELIVDGANYDQTLHVYFSENGEVLGSISTGDVINITLIGLLIVSSIIIFIVYRKRHITDNEGKN